MKKKMLFFIGTLLVGFTVGAATGTKITAMLQNQAISYKGQLSNQQVISYNSTTYVPLRNFSELLKVPVDYKDGVIYLGENTDKTATMSYWDKDIKHMALGRYVLAEYAYNGEVRKNNTGNEYSNYLIFRSVVGEGNIDFPLNGQYKTFEAILSVPQGDENGDLGKFKIYLDGKNVYSKTYTPSDMPEHIKIDVTGAQKISFTMDSSTTLGASVGLFDGKFIK